MIEVWRKATNELPARKLKSGFETQHEAESWVITALSQESICGQGKCFAAAYTRGAQLIEFRASKED